VAKVGNHLLIVFMGAILGAALRLSSEWGLVIAFGMAPKYSLAVVNAFGCGAFAYCAALLTQQKLTLFWLTGCWGAYTSFSALSLVFLLMEASSFQVVFYVMLSALSWGVSFALGQQLARFVMR